MVEVLPLLRGGERLLHRSKSNVKAWHSNGWMFEDVFQGHREAPRFITGEHIRVGIEDVDEFDVRRVFHCVYIL